MTIFGFGSVLVIICTFSSVIESSSTKTKRQIYREQLLPHRGGRVPSAAFHADRLALNRLNKEGIAVPDGVLLEHRNVHNHPHSNRHDPEDETSVLRVVQQSENRYVPEEGRYHNQQQPSVASTYLIRKPIDDSQTNIRTPDQQRPLHQYISQKQHGQHHYDVHPLPQHRPSPTLSNRYPSSPRQQHFHRQPHLESPPTLYHSIPVPFELPNKEVQSENYFSSSLLATPNKLDWSFTHHPDELEKLTFDYNSLLPTSEFDYQQSNFRYYLSPEGLTAYNNYFGIFDEGLRFSRKTAESYEKGSKNEEVAVPNGRYGERINRRHNRTKDH